MNHPVPGSEATLAPHCAAHPELLAVGACTRCGDFFCAACANDGRWCRACGERETRVPWLDRATLGLTKSYFQTLKACVKNPRQFAVGLPNAGSAFEAWLFGLISAALGAIVPSVLMGAFLSLVMLVVRKGQNKAPPSWLGLVIVPVYFFMFMGAFCLAALVWPLVLKLSSKLCSVPMRYGELVRIQMYASGLLIGMWVPLLGLGAFLVQLVITCMAIAAHTRASMLRASLAVLVPFALMLGGFVVSYAGLLWLLASRAGMPGR